MVLNVFKLAERWGFEPQIETSSITDFESAAFDHSAISPIHSQSVIKIAERNLTD